MINNLGTSLPAWQQLQWADGKIVNESDPCKWGGENPPPAIGAKIKINVNGIGNGVVLGYFEHEGFLGVLVQPDDAPAWYLKQNGGNVPCHVFGAEIKAIDPPAPPVEIIVTYRSIDRCRVRRKFKTLAGARKFAVKYMGEHPEIGCGYAVSGDGIGKVTVQGATLREMFPGT